MLIDKFQKNQQMNRTIIGTITRSVSDNNSENSTESQQAENSEIRYKVSFSSEEPYNRWGMLEILQHSKDAVNLETLITTGVLLYHHGRDSNYGYLPIGGIENIALDETQRRCTADILLDKDDEDAVKIAQKIDKGYIKGISVGYSVQEWQIYQENEKSADGRYVGPCAVATKWTPYEISVEPVPADKTVGIGRSQSQIIDNNMEDNNMFKTQDTEEALRIERERVKNIMERCATFGIDGKPFIESGATIERVNDEILRRMEQENKPVTTAGSVQITVDEEDKFRRAATDGLLQRSGLNLTKPADGSNEFRGMRLRDLAIECLQRSSSNIKATRMSDFELFRSALSPSNAFTSILDNSINKSIATAYATQPTTYQNWTAEGNNPDFKPKKIYKISEAGTLEEVQQNGEFKHDEMTDESVTSILATFGKSFGFTRQALINDDLDIISKIPLAYVRAAERAKNRAVYNLLRSNPVMEDGHQLFSSEHKNLGTAAKPSTASYQEAYAAMMHQKNLRGEETLNITPAFVIADPLQFADHSVMLNSVADPSGNNAGRFNAFGGMMSLIVDAEVNGGAKGAIPYYFAASPQECESIIVSYLNGNKSPVLSSQVDFDTLGIKYNIYHDFGVTLADYRGLYKNPGLEG